jgi:hypothetical protein
MSKFPLIGKNVLVIHGDKKTNYIPLQVSEGILLSYDVLKNQKKDSFISVKLSLNNVEQTIEGVLLITFYSKKLQEENAEKLKADKEFKLQQQQANNPIKNNEIQNTCVLSIDEVQKYLKSIDSLSKGIISIYLLDKDSNLNEYKEDGKFFKILSLNPILMQATIQSLWFDKAKSRSSSTPDIKPTQNILSIFNINDLNTPQQRAAGKKNKKRSKKFKKKYTKKHKKRTKKNVKK